MDCEKTVLAASVGMKADKLAELDRLIESQVAAGFSPALSVAVLRRGQLVFSKTIGTARRHPPTPAGASTLFYSWSVAKPITTMAVHLLVQRGQLELDTPIAAVWPGFAKNGKAGVTVRHVLTHRGGFPGKMQRLDWKHLEDWSCTVRAMEELELEWEPGSAVQYHPLNFGWVLGELVRRVDTRPIEVFAREEFFQPLGMRDSYLKITDAELARTVELWAPESWPEGVQAAAMFNLPTVRRAVIPAAQLHTTACDVARFYQMLLNGGELDGVQVLQPESIARATTPSTRPGERERDTRLPSHRGQGLNLGGYADCAWGGERTSARTFGHNGFATNAAFADPDHALVVVILNSGMQPDPLNYSRNRELADAIWAACAESGK